MHAFSRYGLTLKLSFLTLICGLLLTGCVDHFSPDGWAGPTVSGDTLYICTLEGNFLAIDLNDRTVTKDLTPTDQNSEPSSMFGCGAPAAPDLISYAAPVVSGSTFYIGTYSGEVYAIDVDSGTRKWNYDTRDNIVGGLALSGDELVVASSDKIYKFDARNGSLMWDEPFDSGGHIWGGPVISEEVIYFGNLKHNLYAVDLGSGDQVWKREFTGAIASTPLIVDGTLYIGTFEKDFYAIDTATGKDKWGKPFNAKDWFWTKATFDGGKVYVGTLGGTVYSLDASTGNKIWEFRAESGDRFRSSPVVVNDVVVIGCQDDRVYGLDTETGMQKWPPLHFSNDIMADPWVRGTTVYYLDQDNNLHGIDAETGSRLWAQPLD
ncbi:MAG: PQQ-binding-like beta-propeller repeat protein [Dehalococcoidia bacterium]